VIFPVRDGFGLDQLIGSGEIFGDTQFGLWGQGRQRIGQQLIVAEGRFHKELRPFFPKGFLLQAL
jgi:hypothetical protein